MPRTVRENIGTSRFSDGLFPAVGRRSEWNLLDDRAFHTAERAPRSEVSMKENKANHEKGKDDDGRSLTVSDAIVAQMDQPSA